MLSNRLLCVVVFCLSAALSADAGIVWVNSLDGPSGVQCSVTCGSRLALAGLSAGTSSALNYTPQACAVQSNSGTTQIGTLWYNKNTLSCYVYASASGNQPVSAPSSAWYCPCLDRTTLVSNATGTTTESCASSCSKLDYQSINGTYYNSSITSCKQPTTQSICYDSVQNSFGYQPARDSNLACLTVNPPAQTTADTLPAQQATTFQCLCSDANSTANLQISTNCSSSGSVTATAPAPAPVKSLQPTSITSSSLSTGAIVGIAVGCGAGVAVLIASTVFYLRRKPPSSQTGVPGYWIDEDQRNPFDTDARFTTKSTDLVAFEALKEYKSTGKLDSNSNGPESMTTSHRLSDSTDPAKADSCVLPDSPDSAESLANIIELQENKKSLNMAELPMPQRQPDGAIDDQILKIRTGSSPLEETERSASQNDALEDAGLLTTWKIDPTELHCRMKNGKPILLGEGGYGKVYRGVLNKAEVAIKVVTSHDPEQQSKFVQEIVTLRACHNTHIVQFLGACIRDQQTFMAMEFMDRGDLFSQIDWDVSSKFGWYNLGQRIAMDVCKGLCYLHSKRIAHLDLKSPNVLLTSDYRAKIGDVGLGKIISNRKAAATRQGSLFWAAPEQLLGTECSTASDVFAFGTVLWEICSGEKPLQRQTRPLKTPEEAPAELEDLIRRCHAEKPADRPTAEQAFDILRSAARKPTAAV